MKEHLSIIKRVKIFEGLTESEIFSALVCLKANLKTFKKGSVIFSEGEKASFIGIIVSGEIQTQKTDYNGNINIISKLFPSGLIAAVASYTAEKRLPFDVIAVSDAEVICLDNSTLTRSCCKACIFHAKIIENMLNVIAEKNVQLSLKIDILTKRTIREKIIAYLYRQSKRSEGKSFSVDLTRRQMAEYLSINRSALSRELCKMRDDGILDFDGNRFSFK